MVETNSKKPFKITIECQDPQFFGGLEPKTEYKCEGYRLICFVDNGHSVSVAHGLQNVIAQARAIASMRDEYISILMPCLATALYDKNTAHKGRWASWGEGMQQE